MHSQTTPKSIKHDSQNGPKSFLISPQGPLWITPPKLVPNVTLIPHFLRSFGSHVGVPWAPSGLLKAKKNSKRLHKHTPRIGASKKHRKYELSGPSPTSWIELRLERQLNSHISSRSPKSHQNESKIPTCWELWAPWVNIMQFRDVPRTCCSPKLICGVMVCIILALLSALFCVARWHTQPPWELERS